MDPLEFAAAVFLDSSHTNTILINITIECQSKVTIMVLKVVVVLATVISQITNNN